MSMLGEDLAKQLVQTAVPAPAPRLGNDYAASEVGWTWLVAIAERVVELGWCPPAAIAHVDELEASIDRIRKLHDQDQVGILAPGRWCPGCGEPIPCKTIRALNSPT